MKGDLLWVLFTLRRFNRADVRGSRSVSNVFSVLGIGFGVMVLIVVLAVMNGFQRGYIDTIIQVSSAHIRLSGSAENLKKAENLNLHKSFVLFNEAQCLMQGNYGRQSGVLVRAAEHSVMQKDAGFASAVKVRSGLFDIEKNNTIVLGEELARKLAVSAGGTVFMPAVSGSPESDIFPEQTTLFVTGTFKTGYYEVDSNFAFVNLETGKALFGQGENSSALVKIENPERDAVYINGVMREVPGIEAESWRHYNRAFFGALKIEKNMMMFLVFLIFAVVAVNIYNGMRRSIYERREDISVLSSMGAGANYIKSIFIANGFFIGFAGSFLGLLLGLLLSVKINSVFSLAEIVINGFMFFFSALTHSEEAGSFTIFSPVYFYMDKVPVKIFFSEVLSVFLFGIFSSSFAAWIAARKIVKLKPAEVLRYE